ncbi:MAG: Calx-beta domain-containing protein, partial [Acidobacteriota bacterium]
DDRVEGQDAFRVVLAPPSSDAVDVDDGTGVGAIFNDDTATLSIDDPSSPEGDDGNAPLTLTVTVAGAVDGGFSVDFFSADGTATVADGDYLAAEGTLSFAGVDGEQQSIPVQVIGDTALEDDEAFSVRLLAPSHPAVLIADATGEPTILNDDEAVLTVGDLGQAEGNVGATAFAFPVTLTGADVAGGFTVSYSTADGTALAGSDYAAASGMLTFAGAIGETRTISVDVTGDGVLEGDETFAVELASPSVPAISVVGGVGTVLNDDSADITISDVSQPESDGGSTFRFAVTLDGEVEGGFTVPYATADGTATVADGDYASAAGVLTFAGADGESRDIDVAVTGDGTVEADETFTVDLGSASVAGITVGAGAVGTIVNDDSASVAIDDVVQLETDAATTFTFTVSLGGEVADGFTVPYATADGSATVDGGDYGAASGVLTFTGSDGEGQTVEVTVLGDEVVEADEGFTVELGAPSNAAVSASGASGAGTIVNDDDGAALVATLSVAVYEPPYDTVVYEMEITNVGTGDQRDDPDSDELENLLPDELSILAAVSDLPDFELTVDGPANALYGNGPLAAGERVRVTLEAAVDARAGAEISNQALVRFDTDGDGVNDSTGPSDDPSTPTVGDATALGVEAALPDIPTLDGVGLIAMGLLVILGGLRSARRGRKP